MYIGILIGISCLSLLSAVFSSFSSLNTISSTFSLLPSPFLCLWVIFVNFRFNCYLLWTDNKLLLNFITLNTNSNHSFHEMGITWCYATCLSYVVYSAQSRYRIIDNLQLFTNSVTSLTRSCLVSSINTTMLIITIFSFIVPFETLSTLFWRKWKIHKEYLNLTLVFLDKCHYFQLQLL